MTTPGPRHEPFTDSFRSPQPCLHQSKSARQDGRLTNSAAATFSKPWAQALAKAGLSDDLHLRDLRHTGNTLAAEAGASLGELMNRMGHSSTRAARIYLHTREEREQQLAATLDKMARRELRVSGAKRTARRSGTQRARDPQSGDSQSEAGQDE